MKTTDEFRDELYSKYGERLIVPQDAVYLGSKKDIKVVCPIHGARWMRPNNLLSGSGCKECGHEAISSKNKHSADIFLEKARNRHGDKYEYPNIREEYGKHDKVHILCKKCGETFLQRPSMHIFGNGCPNCNPFPKKLSEDALKTAIHDKHKNIELVGFHGGDNDSEITVRCKIHGNEWKTTPHRLQQQKYACKKCYQEERAAKIREKQAELFNRFVEEHYKPFYDVSEAVYVNSYTDVKLICRKHGEFFLKPKKMLSRIDGCPYCKESHLEKETRIALDSAGVQYEREKTFGWLKSKGNMFLDFYVPQYNVAIECQGEQHVIERAGSIMNSSDSFESKVERDKEKLRLCGEHGIRIIYIFGKKTAKNRLDEKFNHMYDDALLIEDITMDSSLLSCSIKNG